MNKDLGLKAKTIYVAKEEQFLVLFVSVCVYLTNQQAVTLGEALSGLGGHSLSLSSHCHGVIKAEENVYLQHSPGGTWTALKLKEQSRMFSTAV